MRTPFGDVTPWLGFWGFLSERSMSRWDRMSDELETRTYGTDKLLCDVLEFWSDASCGWMAALRQNSDLPRVLFVLKTDTEAASKPLRLFLPSLPHGNPALTHLLPLEAGGPTQIEVGHCKLALDSKKRLLNIRLEGLPKAKTPGVYHGMIHIAEEPVALLFIKVEN